MDFSLTQEQQLLKDSIDKYLSDLYSFDARRRHIDSERGYSLKVWKDFADLGWLSIPFAEEHDGFGGSVHEVSLLMEAFGRTLVVEPYLATVLLAGRLLECSGNKEVINQWLPSIIGGDCQAAFAYLERQSRYVLQDVATRAGRDGDNYRLSGSKTVVFNGADADLLVVSARSSGERNDEQGISLFAVPADAEGISRRRYRWMDGQVIANIEFDRVKVPASAMLGAEGEALPVIERVVDEACIALCAEAVGAMEHLYKATVEYASTRKQFGVAIGSFQVLQHRMVDMYIMQEQCKSLLVRALCSTLDGSESAAADIAALKAMVGRDGRRLAESAVQIHGGMGVTEEMSVGYYLKRLMLIDTSFGNADFHRRRFCTLNYNALVA